MYIQIIRDTLVAAANMDYPKDKLTVCICDDGKNRDGTFTLVLSIEGCSSPFLLYCFFLRYSHTFECIPHLTI